VKIFKTRKSEPERLIDSVSDSLGVLSDGLTKGRLSLGELSDGLTKGRLSLGELSDGLTKGRLLKAGLIAGGLAALMAGSAGISSLRRLSEGDS
jgi:hypothetical protein